MTEESTATGMLGNEESKSGEAETETVLQLKTADQSSEVPGSATKHKKKKKKKASDGKDSQQKEMKSTAEETAIQETTELTPDEQLNRELDWCIEQLELGLKTQKTSSKQREEASRALKTLRSSKAPLVKKRQVMRAISGDYRKKIEEERARQFKLIQSALTSARVTTVSECKPVFLRRAERNTPAADKTEQSQETQALQGPRHTDEHTQTDDPTKPFVFTETHEGFCFNFNL